MPIETSVRWKSTEKKDTLLELEQDGKSAYSHSRFLKPAELRELGEACFQAAQMIEQGYSDFIPCFNNVPFQDCEQFVNVPAMPTQKTARQIQSPLIQDTTGAVVRNTQVFATENVQPLSGLGAEIGEEPEDEPLPPVAGSQAVNPVFARKDRERVVPKSRRVSAPVQPGGNGYQATT